MRALFALCALALAGYAIAATPVPQSVGSISIYTPWSGSDVYTGQSYTISYSTTQFSYSSTSCTIQYQRSGDLSWTTITSWGPVVSGNYYWYVPSYITAGQYRIQIYDNTNSNVYGVSDMFTVSSTSSTALAVGWIVFIVIAVFACIACGVCVQYRRRQAAANSNYALMGGAAATTTTVITIPPQQPMPQPAPGFNPPMIYAPPPQQQQYLAPSHAPGYAQQPPQYQPYQPVQPVVVQPTYAVAPPMYAPAPTQYAPPPAYAPGTSGSGGLNMAPTA